MCPFSSSLITSISHSLAPWSIEEIHVVIATNFIIILFSNSCSANSKNNKISISINDDVVNLMMMMMIPGHYG